MILLLTRKIQDTAARRAGAARRASASVLSAAGLGLAVYGVLRSGEWGWVQAKPGGPDLAGLSMTLWLILAGLVVVRLFFQWEEHCTTVGREPLVDVAMLRNAQLTGGLTMFFFQFLIQAGLFFTVPLFLSVALGLSAVETGVRLLPLSITLLARGGRRTAAVAAGLPAARRHVGAGRPARRDRVARSAALEARRRTRDRHRPDAPRRARRRCAGLAARRGDRLGGAPTS